MKHLAPIFLLLLFISCNNKKSKVSLIICSGITDNETEYITIGDDTTRIDNGMFLDTISIKNNVYDYVQLSSWKWPRLVYLDKTKNLNFDFSESQVFVKGDKLNTFLLNSASILRPYSLKWDMENELFRQTIDKELKINFEIIDSVFSESKLSNEIINELKAIEKLKVAHRTANFISYQESNGNKINRDIYEFMDNVNLNNERLSKQVNNRNFQYYYLLDKVNSELPDSIYPFAVIDTVNYYSQVESIRKMIISSSISSAFYSEEVDHDRLISAYEENFGKLDDDSYLYQLKAKIVKLKPGNIAPSIGLLPDINEDLKSIEDFRNENILLTVWGTWCPHCRKELPEIKNLIKKHNDKFMSVGISFDTDVKKWKSYIKDNNWQGIHLLDSERKSEFKSNYLINGTNVYLLIDKNGVIVSSKEWKPSSPELEDLILSLE